MVDGEELGMIAYWGEPARHPRPTGGLDGVDAFRDLLLSGVGLTGDQISVCVRSVVPSAAATSTATALPMTPITRLRTPGNS